MNKIAFILLQALKIIIIASILAHSCTVLGKLRCFDTLSGAVTVQAGPSRKKAVFTLTRHSTLSFSIYLSIYPLVRKLLGCI